MHEFEQYMQAVDRVCNPEWYFHSAYGRSYGTKVIVASDEPRVADDFPRYPQYEILTVKKRKVGEEFRQEFGEEFRQEFGEEFREETRGEMDIDRFRPGRFSQEDFEVPIVYVLIL